jgi:pantoate--beta-alanine ligase
MQTRSDQARISGKTVVLVPTMGYLHPGHLSLITEAKKHGDEVVVSIFVNPAQFGPGEDLAAYPRDFDRDRRLCEDAGADVIFAPDPDTVYGPGYQTYVTLERLPQHLCGLSRPVHFRGVATVVTKLFNTVKPHAAVFGQKDYQQLLVIRQLVRDLNFDIDIIGAPIVREPDGLAMSSRNTYLTPDHRRQALCLSRSLDRARERVQEGETDPDRIRREALALIEAQPDAAVDYVTLCDPHTLEPVTTLNQPVLMALAVKFGKTRLIDNRILDPHP